jgi:hypothetical protein
MPLLAPVTTKVRPSWRGRSVAFHFEVLMTTNVVGDNNGVNAYIFKVGYP